MFLRLFSAGIIIVGAVFAVLAEDSTNQKCGIQAKGNPYPWLAGIEYYYTDEESTIDPTIIKCTGNLISGKHVVTNAHCISNYLGGVVSSVLLGPFKLTSPVNCTEEGNIYNCSDDGVIRVPVEISIPHPRFVGGHWKSAANAYDVAIIILRNMVPYTDVIRPICLPTSDITQLAATDLKLHAAGLLYSRCINTQDEAQTKLHAPVDYINRAKCKELQHGFEAPADQICVNDKTKIMMCIFSGGPLMNKKGSIYELVGLVNYGSFFYDTTPAQSANIFYYLDWIRNEMNKLR